VFIQTRAKSINHELDSITERVFNLLTVSNKGSY
jgi:hypothetical protein